MVRTSFSGMQRLGTIRLFVGCLLAASVTGCRQSSDCAHELLEVALDNQLEIQNSGELLELSNAYIDKEFQWTSVHINLNDGLVGDSLVSSCSNWSYLENPNSTVEIYFPDAFVEDGCYHFSRSSVENDFQIVIKNNLTFGPTFELGNLVTENALMGQEIVARGFSHGSGDEPFDVVTASIQIDNIQSQASSIHFALELADESCIRGSFTGILEAFRRIEVDGDCD